MKTIEKYISSSNIKFIILITTLMGLLFIGLEIYHFYYEHIDFVRERFLATQKQALKNSVEEIISYSEYKRSLTRARLKQNIKNRAVEAWNIADNLYRNYNSKFSDKQVEQLIIEALRNVRYNGSRGYYFGFTMDGIEILFADRPELEGKNMLRMRDAHGRYVVKDMISIAEKSGEGFYEYHWTKPGLEGKDFPKISYVKYFKPLGIVLGTGEYLDDVEKDMQEEVILRLVNTKLGKKGYYFAGTYEGIILSGPARGKNMRHVTDSNGLKVVEALIKLAKNGGGFLTYEMPPIENHRQSFKLSYVNGLQEWGWYIGSGLYIDELEEMINQEVLQMLEKILFGILFVIIICLIIIAAQIYASRAMAGTIKKEFDLFKDFFNNSIDSLSKIDISDINIVEFSELAKIANKTTDLRQKTLEENKQLEKQLQQSRKLDALGRISGGIAHDLNNILTPIFGYTSILKENFDPGSKPYKHLENINKSVERGRDLVNQILSFSKKQPLERKLVSVSAIIEDIFRLVKSTVPSYIKLGMSVETDRNIFADVTQIHQVFMNLVNNSVQAISHGDGRIEINVKDVEIMQDSHLSPILSPGDYVCLTIRDNGHGISEDTIANIFDPFFTTKQDKKGTGLGLSIIHSIIKKHNGHIHVSSVPDKETVFTVYLPVDHREMEIKEIKEKQSEDVDACNGAILLVDDEEFILSSIGELLEMHGYRVFTASNSSEALDIFQSEGSVIDIIISDMNLTEESGDKLIYKLNKYRTHQKVILWSGYSDRINDSMLKTLNIDLLLYKPVKPDTLIQHVKKLLKKRITGLDDGASGKRGCI